MKYKTLLLALLFVWRCGAPVNAEYDNIKSADLGRCIPSPTDPATTVTITASGTYTQVDPIASLPRTNTQTIMIRGTGTSPNYKVELLVSLDYNPKNPGVSNRVGGGAPVFVKPEVGGDLGTFTDSNWHIIPLASPLCVAHKLFITEMGASFSVQIVAHELTQ